jgi:hypothetical protein
MLERVHVSQNCVTLLFSIFQIVLADIDAVMVIQIESENSRKESGNSME